MEEIKKQMKDLISKIHEMPDSYGKDFSGVCFLIEPKVEGEEFRMINSKGICFGRPEYVAACLVGILNLSENKELKMHFLTMMLNEIDNDETFNNWRNPAKEN